MKTLSWLVSVARGPRTRIRIVFAGTETEAWQRYEREANRLRGGGVAKLFDAETRLIAKAGNLSR